MRRERIRNMVIAMLAALAAALAGSAAAHDHGAVQRVIQLAPRAEFRNANHEGVLTYESGRLVLYLQRFSDGTPLSGAEVEATVNFLSEPLVEIAPGVYAGEAGLTAGRNQVEIAYGFGTSAHSVATEIALPARAGAVARNSSPVRTFGLSPWVLVAAALAVYGVVSLILIGGSGRRPSPVRSA